MRILDRKKFRGGPIRVAEGDHLRVTHTNKFGETEELVSTPITLDLAGTYDEAATFETEFEGRKAIGGMILEQQR